MFEHCLLISIYYINTGVRLRMYCVPRHNLMHRASYRISIIVLCACRTCPTNVDGGREIELRTARAGVRVRHVIHCLSISHSTFGSTRAKM